MPPAGAGGPRPIVANDEVDRDLGPSSTEEGHPGARRDLAIRDGAAATSRAFGDTMKHRFAMAHALAAAPLHDWLSPVGYSEG
jgi:hypothetical protein